MQTDEFDWLSQDLGRVMRVKSYGAANGVALLAFPPQGGAYSDFEGFGMVRCIEEYIEAGKVQLFCVDSVDKESWANYAAPPEERARYHEKYCSYIVQDLLPFIRKLRKSGRERILTAGCSMGGYHAVNLYLRFPWEFCGAVSLSGVLDLRSFIGDYMDLNVYYNSPLDYLDNLTDEKYLEYYRQDPIVICTGRGAWEELMINNAERARTIFGKLKVPAWVDFWGFDVNHDWPWWQKQLPYFLNHVLRQYSARLGRGQL